MEAVACGWLLVAIAGSLFGEDGAWLPDVVWLPSPFVVGLGHLDGIDVPFTCAMLGCLAKHRGSTPPCTTSLFQGPRGAPGSARHSALSWAALKRADTGGEPSVAACRRCGCAGVSVVSTFRSLMERKPIVTVADGPPHPR
jgi:hypothetical protein